MTVIPIHGGISLGKMLRQILVPLAGRLCREKFRRAWLKRGVDVVLSQEGSSHESERKSGMVPAPLAGQEMDVGSVRTGRSLG
jgi:hypothetical protein